MNTIKLVKLSRSEANAHLAYLRLHATIGTKAYVTDCQKFAVGKNKHGVYIVHDIAKREDTLRAHDKDILVKTPSSVVGHGRTLKECKAVIAAHLVAEAGAKPLNGIEKAALKRVVENEYSEGDVTAGTWDFVLTDDYGVAMLRNLEERGLVSVFYADHKRGELHDEIQLSEAGRALYLEISAVVAVAATDAHTNFLASLGCTAVGG